MPIYQERGVAHAVAQYQANKRGTRHCVWLIGDGYVVVQGIQAPSLSASLIDIVDPRNAA